MRAAKNELVRAQVEYTKESRALKEVLQQIRDNLSKQTKVSLIVTRFVAVMGGTGQDPSLDLNFLLRIYVGLTRYRPVLTLYL